MAETPNYAENIRSSYGEAQGQGARPHDQQGLLIDLATRLEPLRDRAIRHKGPIEERIVEALQQYNGWTDGANENTKNKPIRGRKTADEAPVVHITRQITDQITAKIINMLLPSNERGWDIDPTPDPELQEAMAHPAVMAPVLNGMGQEMPPELMMGGEQPMTTADIAAQELDEAEKRCAGMRTVMDDQMSEAKFPKLGRQVIKSACKVGSGFVHGPIMTGRTRVKRSRTQGVDELGNAVAQWVKEIQEDTQPDFAFVDPLAFYPEDAESLDIAEWAWLWESMSPSRVEKLKRWPGFMAEQIDVLLKLKPDHGELKSRLAKRRSVEGLLSEHEDKNYSMWRYFGPVPNATLAQLGEMEIPETGDEDDLSRSTMAEVWMSQGIVLKVKITPMEETDRLPFYGMCYQESDSSIFGYGVPDQVRDSQAVIDASWHMVLHNAAISAGPLVIRLAGALRPLDGDNNIDGGLKQFEVDTSEIADFKGMDQVIKVVQIDPRIDQLMAINERAIEHAQRETNFPVMAQGEPTEPVTTASGLAMLMNAQTVHQRMVAQRWDDDVMIPALEALYDWNMTYHPDDEIKGDFEIVAHGATRLVNKDMQAQHLQVIAALSDNLRFQPFSKDYELYKELVKVSEANVDSLVISDDEYEALQQAEPSPMEQAELAEKQGKARKASAEAAEIEAKLQQGPEQGPDLEHVIALEKLKLEDIGQVRKLQEKMMELESAELRALAAGEIELAQIEERRREREADVDLNSALKLREINSKELLKGMDLRLGLEREKNRDRNLDMGRDSF
jgi:hypothetical protein